MPMTCLSCGKHGRLLGEDRDWEPVDSNPAERRRYRCRHCGNHQRHRVRL